jgi:hypothetical protein
MNIVIHTTLKPSRDRALLVGIASCLVGIASCLVGIASCLVGIASCLALHWFNGSRCQRTLVLWSLQQMWVGRQAGLCYWVSLWKRLSHVASVSRPHQRALVSRSHGSGLGVNNILGCFCFFTFI